MRTVRLPVSRLYFYITLFRVCTSAHLDGGSPFRRLSIFSSTVSREIRYSLYFLTIFRSFGRSSFFRSAPVFRFSLDRLRKGSKDRRGEEIASLFDHDFHLWLAPFEHTGEISGEAEGGKSARPRVAVSMNKSLCSLLSRSKKKREGRSRLPPHLLRGRSMRQALYPSPGRRAARKETSERAKSRRTRASSRDSEEPIGERAIDDELFDKLNVSRFTADRKLDPTLSNADH